MKKLNELKKFYKLNKTYDEITRLSYLTDKNENKFQIPQKKDSRLKVV